MDRSVAPPCPNRNMEARPSTLAAQTSGGALCSDLKPAARSCSATTGAMSPNNGTPAYRSPSTTVPSAIRPPAIGVLGEASFGHQWRALLQVELKHVVLVGQVLDAVHIFVNSLG